ncbi:MAG: hypothetical protein HYT98_02115 [Candidatus Sungbacteria bacterium]|nr:hypothetical protein [Candidatus Sungbacteria bacterium]
MEEKKSTNVKRGEWLKFAYDVFQKAKGEGLPFISPSSFVTRVTEFAGKSDRNYKHLYQIPGLRRAVDFLLQCGAIERIEIEKEEGNAHGFRITAKTILPEVLAAEFNSIRVQKKTRASEQTDSEDVSTLELVGQVVLELAKLEKVREERLQAAEDAVSKLRSDASGALALSRHAMELRQNLVDALQKLRAQNSSSQPVVKMRRARQSV